MHDRRLTGAGLAVLLVAVAAAACSGDGESRASEEEYLAALTASMQADDPDNADDVPYSEQAAACLGRAYLDVIGFERLTETATPEEIEANEVDVVVSEDEGTAIATALVDCHPGVVDELAAAFSASINADEDSAVTVDEACMAEVDPPELAAFVGTQLAAGDSGEYTRDAATFVVDWIMGCGDVRVAMIEEMAAGSDEAARCLEARVSEDLIRAYMISGYASDEDSAAREELAAVIEDCEPAA